ncbi:hypothetical protein AVI51_04625 [Piscirickettsia salmonis]|uniref:Uncharacterized protein n=1 Tax=Piscirickettsia salmonis TaxID=1238 RepID=A0A9Q5VCR9_PISSA|nr:hypothetical protein [Piscirickettsia salmonis]APS50208.1 hypothetical protein AVI50_04675 [Piscirickettsia salmonis]APS53410.1 hypothetical protein AVI51_04625 [Piscirickettsia salmonis]APS58582.1 hypothetical protein AVI52_15950 [Piscirickettsia salmonis]ERL61426.1 hypothetical protein K661_02234 [Piscirickettsia salmonis LF-89 = ATCC VR-1361]PEQ17602.1 hypothetical protein X973_01200 [Piscirickettsia salmonis]
MSDFYKECNVSQGFNINLNIHQCFGYINYLRIGELELTADMNTSTSIEGEKSAHVGVISDLFWSETAKVKPITIDFRLSVSNQQKLAEYIQKNNFNSDVLVEFATYDYDPNAKIFYSSLNTDKETLEGNLEVKERGKLGVFVAKVPEEDIPSPANYFSTLSIVANAKEQHLISASSASIKTVLPWGVEILI